MRCRCQLWKKKKKMRLEKMKIISVFFFLVGRNSPVGVDVVGLGPCGGLRQGKKAGEEVAC
jgi:hypothetical protein